MADVDAAIVFLPRFTTLVGASSFASHPLDTSRFGAAQFQLWRGPLRGTSPTFLAYLEESLDAETWVLGPSTPTGYDPATDDPTLSRPKLFSYGFRLRWFRIRVELGGTSPVVTCWAEGLLRDGGGGGAWVQGGAGAAQLASARAVGSGSGATLVSTASKGLLVSGAEPQVRVAGSDAFTQFLAASQDAGLTKGPIK